jgi:hypothetical protein
MRLVFDILATLNRRRSATGSEQTVEHAVPLVELVFLDKLPCTSVELFAKKVHGIRKVLSLATRLEILRWPISSVKRVHKEKGGKLAEPSLNSSVAALRQCVRLEHRHFLMESKLIPCCYARHIVFLGSTSAAETTAAAATAFMVKCTAQAG